jgi:AmmeMemoRadiSam system protein B
VRFGLSIPEPEIDRLLHTLDQAFLLENDRFAEARESALAAYRNAPFRPAMDSGVSYPAAPEDLARLLHAFLDEDAEPASDGACRGLICPHIDYARGGHVYARIWGRAADAVRQAETVILLGTDHYGEDGTWTLTRQNYSTPFGVLPTDQDAVSQLAQAIGERKAFEGELRHRGEHSIELAAVWLHFMLERRPCKLVPVLCGSFGRFFRGEGDPDSDEPIRRICEVLRPLAASGEALVVAAADLSHVGPAFGGSPLDLVSKGRLQASDDGLVRCICAGDARGFFEAIRGVEDRNNVCGASPIYLALKLLGPIRGESVAYDRCPADPSSTSTVSICGVLLR